MARNRKTVPPGELLAKEFLKPLRMSNYRLAKEIGVPAQRIGEILAGKRGITADTDVRLCRFFGLAAGRWLRLQADYDVAVAQASLRRVLARITPWAASKGAVGRRRPRRPRRPAQRRRRARAAK